MKLKYSRLTVYFIIVLFFGAKYPSVFGQKPAFDHYGPKDGLVTSQVLTLEKDKNGFLWLGTENGLVRFDAHTFLYYHYNYLDENTISSNYISDLKCDKHNRLWISTGKNLNVLDIKTGKIQRYQDAVFKGNLPKITDLYYEEDKDVMWISTSAGIFFNQGKKIALQMVEFEGVTGQIHDIEYLKNGLWAIACDVALFVYDPKNKISTPYFHDYHVMGDKDGFVSLFVENDSMVWAGSWVYGMISLNLNTGHVSTYTYSNPLQSQNGVLSIQKLSSDHHELWVATTQGIQIFNKQKKTFHSVFSENVFDLHGIPGAGFSFLKDEKALWIGTQKGLHKYDLLNNFIKNLPLDITIHQEFTIPQDICFENNASGKDSIVWLSSPYGNFLKYDIIQKKQSPLPKPLDHLFKKKTWPYSMIIDDENILWTSSEKYPLLLFDLKKEKILEPEKIDLVQSPLLQMYVIDQKTIWLANTESWYIAEKKKNKIVLSKNIEIQEAMKNNFQNLVPIPYICVHDSKNNLWFLAVDKSKNLRIPCHYDFFSKKLTVLQLEKYPQLKQLGWIDGLMCLTNDDVFISGFSGFGFLKKTNESFTYRHYVSQSNKNNIHPHHFVEDNSGNIIMSTDIGISYLKLKNHMMSTFSYFNSSIGNVIQPGIYVSPYKGVVYVGQKFSLDYFDPSAFNFPKPGKIQLSNIEISRYKNNLDIKNGSYLYLKHYQNNIKLSVSNLFFTNSGYSKYYYRWSEEDDWMLNVDNTFHFTNLSHGKYHLSIKSANGFGVLGDDILVLHFIISPPFHKAWWFYVLITFLGLLVIYIIFRYRDLQRQKLEKLRHNIARDLHDDLGSSLSYIRILSESEANKTKNNISFQNISDKTAEIMNNMSEIIWSINPVYDSFNNVIIRLQEFAIDTLEPLGIQLKFENDILPDQYKLSPEDRRQYYLIFKEAINNTAKYSRATYVKLKIQHQKKTVITTLEDNGIGFDDQLINRGNGLKNMSSRAKNLGAQLFIQTGDSGTIVRLHMKI